MCDSHCWRCALLDHMDLRVRVLDWVLDRFVIPVGSDSIDRPYFMGAWSHNMTGLIS